LRGEWRKIHDEELCSSSIIRMIRWRRMRLAGLVARMGEKRNAYRLLVGKPKGSHKEDQDESGWILI
jgi:hypothetical protein